MPVPPAKTRLGAKGCRRSETNRLARVRVATTYLAAAFGLAGFAAAFGLAAGFLAALAVDPTAPATAPATLPATDATPTTPLAIACLTFFAACLAELAALPVVLFAELAAALGMAAGFAAAFVAGAAFDLAAGLAGALAVGLGAGLALAAGLAAGFLAAAGLAAGFALDLLVVAFVALAMASSKIVEMESRCDGPELSRKRCAKDGGRKADLGG